MHEQVGRISRRRGFGLLLSFYRNICVVVFTVAEWVGSPVTLQARVTNALFIQPAILFLYLSLFALA
jgi:hypothetical protein